MTRKAKRSGTRGGGGRGSRLPTDLADAAEAALDDMLRTSDGEDEEPKTQTRAPSNAEVGEDDIEDEDVLPTARRDDLPLPATRHSKMPLPAPPRTTSVHTLDPVPRASPVPRATPPSAPRPSPLPASPPRPSPLPASPSRPSPLPASPPRAVSPAVVARPTPPLARAQPAPAAPHAATPTPVLPRPPRRDLSEVLDSLRPPTNVEPAASWTGPTVGDSPRARSELLETSPLAQRYEPLDETNRVPTELPIDLDDPISAEADDLVPARAEVAALQVAVLEDSAQLGSVQSAIAASGHVVHVAASGRDGVQRIVAALEDPDSDIDAVVVALPGGEAVIEAALALEPHRPIVIASLGRSPLDAIQRAHGAGADLVTVRPHDVDRLAPILFAASRLFVEKRALAARGGDGDDMRSLVAYDVFERMVDLEVARAKKYDYPLAVALFSVEVGSAPPPGLRGILRARAGNALIHSVRDIDIATQLEHERFLVLMPYTDVKSAAVVARRVIAAVASCDPVVSAGTPYPPRLVGAVAGALGGQPLSFAKLMKDATRVLEQARRDGAELAVQP